MLTSSVIWFFSNICYFDDLFVEYPNWVYLNKNWFFSETPFTNNHWMVAYKFSFSMSIGNPQWPPLHDEFKIGLFFFIMKIKIKLSFLCYLQFLSSNVFWIVMKLYTVSSHSNLSSIKICQIFVAIFVI